MTLEELFANITTNPEPLLIYFGMLPVLAGGTSFIAKGEPEKKPYPIIFSVLVYMACIPGIFAVMILLNDLFTHLGWRRLDVYAQILPIISMVLTLVIISKRINLTILPGFKKLSGFVMIVAITFTVIFVLERLSFHVLFLGSIWQLLILFVILFVGLKFAWERFIHKG